MYKESKKVFLIGVVLSVISWLLITEAIDAGTFTVIYSPVIIVAFMGLMLVLYGITNSGSPTTEEHYEKYPWEKQYMLDIQKRITERGNHVL